MEFLDILLYVGILFAKMFEVSLATIRIVLITRGERVLGAAIGFFEVIIWMILVSTVLTDIMENPVKLIVYAIGFSLGNYFGSVFEEKLGVGTVRIEAIVVDEDGEALVNQIRSKGYAVTVIEGSGMNCKRHVLILNVKRKRLKEVVSLLRDNQSNIVITINDIKPVYGGFGLLKK
ncbi:MAG: DUF5698 domain-containing protein [Vallitaleaceae bacterium]|nr:DUF5698 domain-containing protein [Vallitaleaceae bacterium]